ncbi:MAG: hypothetical protein K8I29_19690 [Alphaproteobacteria bacterium]|uniref:Uncharacterized protein n=1 Tax=Candidatus Nitrobium versatile TaxID=2884831 RepID=A0A953SFD4_9BACT|nr:hypothetical protein [Candidatus Nitrobium versatile]
MQQKRATLELVRWLAQAEGKLVLSCPDCLRPFLQRLEGQTKCFACAPEQADGRIGTKTICLVCGKELALTSPYKKYHKECKRAGERRRRRIQKERRMRFMELERIPDHMADEYRPEPISGEDEEETCQQ